MENRMEYAAGTPLRCNRCQGQFVLGRPVKGAVLGRTDAAARLSDFIACPRCSATDVHWVYRWDLIKAGFLPLIIKQVGATMFTIPGVYEGRCLLEGVLRRAAAGGYRHARILHADGREQDVELTIDGAALRAPTGARV